MDNIPANVQSALIVAKMSAGFSKLPVNEQTQISNAIESKLSGSKNQNSSTSGTVELLSISVGCVACEAAVNAVVAIPIGALIVAGTVTVGPETAVVGVLSTLFSSATTAEIATVINGALAASGGATVEGVVSAICEYVGCCS